MPSLACRFFVGFAILMGQIPPAGAQFPQDEREIAESVIYRFGRHIFMQSAGVDVGHSETSFLADAASLVSSDDDLTAAVTTGFDGELLSDEVE